MDTEKLLSILGADFYTGVPDSQLKALCDCLMNTYGIDARHHVIAANEGNCLAIAAGYHLSTGKLPVVYMQNSGQGNIVNPLASLTNDKVYAIPCLFVIGWRGEPGVHDEPQHVYQGEITLSLLELMDVKYFVIDGATTEEEVKRQLAAWQPLFAAGKQAAFVVKKGALQYGKKVEYRNNGTM
ncbi:MAG: phosphonopyruvate decarboxylase, partial [Clostridia bacterium]|nr:phosphonopyruvate decarboxylase [Clostridia bacterium]